MRERDRPRQMSGYAASLRRLLIFTFRSHLSPLIFLLPSSSSRPRCGAERRSHRPSPEQPRRVQRKLKNGSERARSIGRYRASVSYPDHDGGWGNGPDSPDARRQPPYAPQAPQQPRTAPRAAGFGGADGNERLTALTGAVLLVLLAVEGVTILRVGRLLTLHIFLGMLLLGPVTLKAGSVIYRFARYYAGSAPYRRKGPPVLLLRLLGPVVSADGGRLRLRGDARRHRLPARARGILLHKASFILWFGAMTVHVIAYLPRLPRLLAAEGRGVAHPGGGAGRTAAAGRHARRAAEVLGGRGTRLALLPASLLAGLLIALLTVHLGSQWRPAGFLVRFKH